MVKGLYFRLDETWGAGHRIEDLIVIFGNVGLPEQDGDIIPSLASSGINLEDGTFVLGSVHNGKIHNVQIEKGYGFIETEGGGRIFFHRSNLVPTMSFATLIPGLDVKFNVASGIKGMVADQVTSLG